MPTPPGTRPLTRTQVLENRAFLRALGRSGNAQTAADEVGVLLATLKYRRARHPTFATEWEAALVVAEQALKAKHLDFVADDLRVARNKSGRYQVRRRRPGGMQRGSEQAFLSALSATANVSLSAAAAGFSATAFYARARTNPGFAREMRLALQEGAGRLEAALLESFTVTSHADDAWRHDAPPAIPPISTDQALWLLRIHEKTICGMDEPAHIKRRRGESREAHSFRLSVMYEQRMQREREKGEIAEAERQARGEVPYFEVPIELVDLAWCGHARNLAKADR